MTALDNARRSWRQATRTGERAARTVYDRALWAEAVAARTAGDHTRATALQAEAVALHDRFWQQRARQMYITHPGWTYDDCLQTVRETAVETAGDYDPTHRPAAAFITLVNRRLRYRIDRAVGDAHLIRRSEHTVKWHRRVRATYQRLEMENRRAPTAAEVAYEVGLVGVAQVARLLAGTEVEALEVVDPDGRTGDRLRTPAVVDNVDWLDDSWLDDTLGPAARRLTTTQRRVLDVAYRHDLAPDGDPDTAARLAGAVGVTPDEAVDAHTHALELLRAGADSPR